MRPCGLPDVMWSRTPNGGDFVGTHRRTGLRLRLTAEGYRIYKLLDGKSTLSQVADTLGSDCGLPTATRLRELTIFVRRLAEAGALQGSLPAGAYGYSLLAIGNADAFCGWLAERVEWSLRWPIQVPLLALMILACVSFVDQLGWPLLLTVSQLSGLQWAIVGIVTMATLVGHELAHAIMLKHAGLSVTEIGVLSVRPLALAYVDVTAVRELQNTGEQLKVIAAGVYVHLLVATIAQAVTWTPLFSPVAQMVAVVGYLLAGANAWPLWGSDGYYAVAVVCRRPNLIAIARRVLKVMTLGPRAEFALELLDRGVKEVLALAVFGILYGLWNCVVVIGVVMAVLSVLTNGFWLPLRTLL